MSSLRTVLRCLVVPVLMLSSTAALAQSVRADEYQIRVKNETSSCAWITITAPPGGKAIFGNLSAYTQLKAEGKERSKTGPLWVSGGAEEYVFTVPMRAGYRVRAEVQQQNCAAHNGKWDTGSIAGGNIFDTSITIDDPNERASAFLSLKKGNGNYYFQR